jgi:D-aspartate ligase
MALTPRSLTGLVKEFLVLEDNSTPVVVLVCHHHVGLGIVRSLGRLGVPVYCIDANRFCPAFFSRYCRGKFLWDLHASPDSASLRFLLEVGRTIGRRTVLIPTSDIGTMFVEDHAAALAERFIFPNRDAGLIRALCSKRDMYFLAKRCNVPAPETSFPRSRTDVLEYLASARFPILFKPIYPHLALQSSRPWRMALAHTEQELLHHYDALEDPSSPNVMLQEYIPGADHMTWTFNGYFDQQGECRLAFTGRKLRNFPPYFGQASLAVCQHNEDVEKTALRFMTSIGYKGPLDLGFRYDARDGQYKVNDVNPRIGAMFRLFVGQNGMDVARALYQDTTGQSVIPSCTPEGRKWIVEDVDLFSSIRYYRDDKFTLRQWLNSFHAIQETTFLSRDDPWPIVGACLLDAGRVLPEALGARRRRFQLDGNGIVATHTRTSAKVKSQLNGSIGQPQFNNESHQEVQRATSRLE